MLRVLVILGLVCGVLTALDGPLAAGFHDNLPCIEDASYTIDLYLPAAYDQEPERHFPAYFMSSPGGDPGVMALREWADQRQFMLVGLNNSRNGPWEPILRNQDLALKSLEAWGVRLHHCLRYAGGFSGGGLASMRLVSRFPDHFAGVQLSGRNGDRMSVPAYMAIAYYIGRQDSNWDFVKTEAPFYREAGNPVWLEIHDGGHDGAPRELLIRQLDWLYLQTVLSHPLLTPEERDAGLVWVEAERARVLALADPALRQQGLEALLDNAGIRASRLGEGLLADWGQAVLACFDASAAPVDGLWILVEAQRNPVYRSLERDMRKQFDERLKVLKKDSAVKAELKAEMAYQQAVALMEQANTDKKQQAAQALFNQIAKALPETRYGRLAAGAQ